MHCILKLAVTVSVGGDIAHRGLPSSVFCVSPLVLRTGSHFSEAANGRRTHTPTNSITYETNILLVTRRINAKFIVVFTAVSSVAKTRNERGQIQTLNVADAVTNGDDDAQLTNHIRSCCHFSHVIGRLLSNKTQQTLTYRPWRQIDRLALRRSQRQSACR